MAQVLRSTLVVGNWKMHKTIAEAKAFIQTLIPLVDEVRIGIWIAVPFTALHAAVKVAKKTKIIIGAQNASEHEAGAFTGEISCSMLKEAGAHFVILGHSERRQLFMETDACVNKKIKRALLDNIRPIVCVGETLEQHQKGMAYQVLEKQISQSLEGLSDEEMQNVILAYEPIWAIGTNQTATPEQAQKAHKFCREYLSGSWTVDVAEKMTILYGGSVKPENASMLLEQPDVDGFLVGGGSLSVDSFSKIIHCCDY